MSATRPDQSPEDHAAQGAEELGHQVAGQEALEDDDEDDGPEYEILPAGNIDEEEGSEEEGEAEAGQDGGEVAEAAPAGKPRKAKRPQQVYTLVIEVGRSKGDGLPKGATGAALMCYASGVDEAEAVRETVAILKQADLSPLDVTGYGTLEERLKQGDEIDEVERELMARALDENSVIVAQMTPFFDEN